MWTRLDDGLLDHPKILAAGQLLGRDGACVALGTYVMGLVWTNKQLTDGFLPTQVVVGFADKNRRQATKLADALVKAGLWERVDGGFRIHDFEHYNPSAAKVRANREWTRQRKQLFSDIPLMDQIRHRDQDRCRYCGEPVNWTNRRGPLGAEFDHVKPRGPNSLDNVVIACHRCNNVKGSRTPEEANMPLLPPPSRRKNGAA